MVRRKINAVVATCAALCVKALEQSRQSRAGRAVKECSGKVRLRWVAVNLINAYLLYEYLAGG